MKAAKYRDMSVDEIDEQILQIRKELFDMRVGNTTKELESPARIRVARRDLARALTVLSQKRSAE
jgi:large subunit ribosomal protein L29